MKLNCLKSCLNFQIYTGKADVGSEKRLTKIFFQHLLVFQENVKLARYWSHRSTPFMYLLYLVTISGLEIASAALLFTTDSLVP